MKLVLSLALFCAFLLFPTACADGVRDGLALAAGQALPALFPFFVAGGLLTRSGLAQALARLAARPLAVLYRLPSEAEWSYAAYSVQDKSYAASLNWADVDTSTPQMMMGGVWEYTSSEYVPLNRVLGYDGYSVENDDVIVKGGSYLNAGDGITPDTIGMIGKSTCSDYVGFRIAK